MLEIGSIVYLKSGNQKLMILSRGAIVQEKNEQILYDYVACLYPFGYVEQQMIYFNEENIDKILYHGFRDEDEERFQELYKEWLEKSKNTWVRREITGS